VAQQIASQVGSALLFKKRVRLPGVETGASPGALPPLSDLMQSRLNVAKIMAFGSPAMHKNFFMRDQ
jgi:hypothetical protein